MSYGGVDSENGSYGPVGASSGSTPEPNPSQGPVGPAGPPGAGTNALFEARMQLDDATHVSLRRYAGLFVQVNGELVGPGSLGFSLTPTDHLIAADGSDAGVSMSVNTTYHVYVSNSVAAYQPLSLRASSTPYSVVDGVRYLGASGNALNWRWVGLVRTISNGGTPNFADSVLQRFVVNYYNRQRLPLKAVPNYENGVADSATSYAYTGQTYGPINGGTGDKVEFLSLGEDAVEYRGEGLGSAASVNGFYRLAVGEDSQTTAAVLSQNQQPSGISGQVLCFSCGRPVVMSEGYHYLQLLAQDSNGTSTWFANGRRFGGADKPEGTKIVATILG